MSRVVRWVIEIVFWGFTCLAVLAILSVIIGAGVQPIVAYIAPGIPLIALPMIGMIVRSRREKRLQQVLVHIEHAVRLNLPLVQMMAAARDSETGVLAERLNSLANALRDGYSMADAIELSLPECTEQVVATIAAGEQIGRLAPALRRLVHDDRSAADIPDPVLRPFHRVYPLIVLVAVMTCLTVLSTFVMPKFNAIMRDFGMQLPTVSENVISAGHTFVGPLLLIATTTLLVMTGRYFWQAVKPFGIELKPLGIVDRIRWSLPVTHGLDLNSGLADAFTLLADAVGAGIPADRALHEAGRLSMNSILQQRLDEWATRIREGELLNAAARRSRMPAVVVGILSTSSDSATLEPAVRFLERYYRSRFSRANYVVQSLLVPITTIVLGIPVLWVALSLFTPMIMLIDKLASEAFPL